MRVPVRFLAVLAWLLPALAFAQPAVPAKPLPRLTDPRPIDGLIVRLKDAPSHEQALALGMTGAVEQSLQGVLRRAGVAATRIRPTGRASQRLDFGHVLGRDEAEHLAARLSAQPEVQWVDFNTRERRLALPNPNDPFYQSGQQWWLQQPPSAVGYAGAPGFSAAWAISTGAAVPAAVVAVLDTGITCHDDLGNMTAGCIGGHVLPGYDFVSDTTFANDGNGRDADPRDPGDWVSKEDLANPLFASCDVENSSWHGTDMTGLIGALTDNGIGVAAANWEAQIVPVRVAGKCGADVTDIIDGMYWAAGLRAPDGSLDAVPVNAHPARIVNISFGSSNACGPEYQAAIDDLRANNVIVVAAAGNERAALDRPANCSGVIAVGAVNQDGFKSNYSNFGAATANSLLLMTVGGDPPQDGAWGSLLGDTGLLTIDNSGTTTPGGSAYARLYGTSFSTPLVSAAASLMLGVNPGLSAAQVIDGLRKSARPHVTSNLIGVCSSSNPGRCICDQSICGAGLLDVAQALAYAQNPAAYVPPARQPVLIDDATIAQAVALGPDQAGISPAPPPPTSSGGGALDPTWLAALALAVLAVARASRAG
ncbi:MAG: S8 family peptidase [Betaproteobacteria bacterium]